MGIPCGRHVDKGQLELYRTVKVVEKVAPAVEDGGFVFVLIQLIVDVLKLDGFRKVGVFDTADPVGIHLLKRDTVLC